MKPSKVSGPRVKLTPESSTGTLSPDSLISCVEKSRTLPPWARLLIMTNKSVLARPSHRLSDSPMIWPECAAWI